jgi:DNA polymerase III delta prime subunit
MESSSLPDNNTKMNIKLFLLDPLSVIIKLAIIGNKPVGTKILIKNNILYLQEPGMFQSITRIIYNTNKTDLQYMYNPIQIACTAFLSKESIQKTPRIKNLFVCAQNGLKKLMETYKSCSIITLCLNYYYAIITNHVEEKYNDYIFYKDTLTSLYTKELFETLNDQWSTEKIKVILDLITFLTNDAMASNNVKTLETIMENTDPNSEKIIGNI